MDRARKSTYYNVHNNNNSQCSFLGLSYIQSGRVVAGRKDVDITERERLVLL